MKKLLLLFTAMIFAVTSAWADDSWSAFTGCDSSVTITCTPDASLGLDAVTGLVGQLWSPAVGDTNVSNVATVSTNTTGAVSVTLTAANITTLLGENQTFTLTAYWAYSGGSYQATTTFTYPTDMPPAPTTPTYTTSVTAVKNGSDNAKANVTATISVDDQTVLTGYVCDFGYAKSAEGPFQPFASNVAYTADGAKTEFTAQEDGSYYFQATWKTGAEGAQAGDAKVTADAVSLTVPARDPVYRATISAGQNAENTAQADLSSVIEVSNNVAHGAEITEAKCQFQVAVLESAQATVDNNTLWTNAGEPVTINDQTKSATSTYTQTAAGTKYYAFRAVWSYGTEQTLTSDASSVVTLTVPAKDVTKDLFTVVGLTAALTQGAGEDADVTAVDAALSYTVSVANGSWNDFADPVLTLTVTDIEDPITITPADDANKISATVKDLKIGVHKDVMLTFSCGANDNYKATAAAIELATDNYSIPEANIKHSASILVAPALLDYRLDATYQPLITGAAYVEPTQEPAVQDEPAGDNVETSTNISYKFQVAKYDADQDSWSQFENITDAAGVGTADGDNLRTATFTSVSELEADGTYQFQVVWTGAQDAVLATATTGSVRFISDGTAEDYNVAVDVTTSPIAATVVATVSAGTQYVYGQNEEVQPTAGSGVSMGLSENVASIYYAYLVSAAVEDDLTTEDVDETAAAVWSEWLKIQDVEKDNDTYTASVDFAEGQETLRFQVKYGNARYLYNIVEEDNSGEGYVAAELIDMVFRSDIAAIGWQGSADAPAAKDAFKATTTDNVVYTWDWSATPITFTDGANCIISQLNAAGDAYEVAYSSAAKLTGLDAELAMDVKSEGQNFQVQTTEPFIANKAVLDLDEMTLTLSYVYPAPEPEVVLTAKPQAENSLAIDLTFDLSFANIDEIGAVNQAALAAALQYASVAFEYVGKPAEGDIIDWTGAESVEAEETVNGYTMSATAAKTFDATEVGTYVFRVVVTVAVPDQTPVEYESDKTAEVVVAAPASSYTELYIVGSMNDWKFVDSWKMTTTDGVEYTYTFTDPVCFADGSMFKIAEADWAGDIYGVEGTAGSEHGQYVPIWTIEKESALNDMQLQNTGSSQNIIVEGCNLWVNEITFNTGTMKLSIDGGTSATAVEEASEVSVYAVNGRIYVDADEYQIINMIGQDVTAANGNLSGYYIVKVDGSVIKLKVD